MVIKHMLYKGEIPDLSVHGSKPGIKTNAVKRMDMVRTYVINIRQFDEEGDFQAALSAVSPYRQNKIALLKHEREKRRMPIARCAASLFTSSASLSMTQFALPANWLYKSSFL